MAMEKLYSVRDTHTRALTAIGYNPARREIMIGCEDGIVKSWEADTGKIVHTFHEHRGWVTDFLYWGDPKVIFSSANDGAIVAYGSGGGISDKIVLPEPVYCMAINQRRNQLLCGVNAGIRVYDLDEEKKEGHFIINKCLYISKEHTDIVRCLLCVDSRVYSAGYDQKLIIYDSSYSKCMEPFFISDPPAHDAGISTLLLVKDNENNTWIVTGSFDKTVKIWSPDGKLVHKLEGFLSTVTGVCYVPKNKTIWAAGGTSYAYLYDPKSGDNVSDFIGTFQTQEEEKYHLQLMKYFPELNVVVGTTSRRHLIVWKYNPSGCITALKCRTPIESLTYTRKVPILIFSGDSDGAITKWERMQSNHFMYSKENFPLLDAKKAKQKKKDKEIEEIEKRKMEEQRLLLMNKKNKEVSSHYAYNMPAIPPVSIHNHPHTTILKTVFVEALDLIIACCEDSNMYVWGFDEDAVKALQTMEPPDHEVELLKRYAILLGRDSELLKKSKTSESDSVTNRVAGFVCKHILSEHTSCVTAITVIGRKQGFDTTYVVSGGWDRRIIIWNLETGVLHDVFRHSSLSNHEHIEIACDGVITDLAYNPKRNEIAYSSTDKMVYIRRFSPSGSQMLLLNTLQGHFAEVTCCKWNDILDKWVTGSEDGTIRIWSSEGMNDCEQVLSTMGSVQTMCVDNLNGAIVAGVQEYIKVYDPKQYRLVQQNVGHTDAVKSILHIPERNQYVSCSGDRTIRIWNAWKMPKAKRKTSKDKRETDLSKMATEHGASLDNVGSNEKSAKDEIEVENKGSDKDTMAVILEVDEADMEIGEEAISLTATSVSG